jgi:hypothetical protein
MLFEMTDHMDAPTDLIVKRIEALYRCDHRGRLLSVNQWKGGTAPRLHIMRTAERVMRRFRADLPDDLVRRLEDLCVREPVREPLGRLPAQYNQYLDLLSSYAPVERVWAGPAYKFAPDILPREPSVAIRTDNADRLCGGFEDWLPEVPHRQPFVAIVQDDHAISICASVRISNAVHCAGVETLAGYRRNGHAVNAVASWAAAVRSLGATPFYSTSWENIASQRVAARLQLSLVGVDFHIT